MDHRVQKVIERINNNLRREPTLSQMALSVNLSPSRMYHLFKDETGVSPKQYVMSLRVQTAKNLLTTTFMSVKEIAMLVGAKDESHFVRHFKKQSNLTPVQYRTLHHTGELNPRSHLGNLQMADSANK